MSLSFGRGKSAAVKTKIEVRFKGIISTVVWPKKLEEHMPGGNAIVKIHIIKVLEGEDVIHTDEYVTIKGPMPRIEYYAAKIADQKESTIYIVHATQVIDPVWGVQYDIINMRMDFPLDSVEDQKKFLSRVLTEKQVESLFGLTDNPMKLLEDRDIETLCQIKGVSEKTAKKLIAKYDASIDSANAFVSLGEYGLTNRAIQKLVKIYHSPDIAIERIKENPYVLIREVRGYGWTKADQIALNQGIERDSEKRIKAYTEYYLEEQCEANGHSWMDINVLLTAVQTECAPVTDEKLIAVVKDMLSEEVEKHFYDVGIEDEDGDEESSLKILTEKGPLLYFEPQNNRVGLMRYYNIEQTVAENLFRIQTAESSIYFDKDFCAKVIKEVEEEQGFEYTEEQINAIWNILNNQVSILTGKAGTGKSFTVNAIVKILKAYGKAPEMCALSGRAASKLGEITHIHGSTIHKLLGYNPKKGGFTYTDKNRLPCDMVILDEASMVGGELFASLLKAIREGTKFLMVGDVAQLESIGMGNVLKDCMASGVISSNILTKIHRQAQQSGIITESLRVSNGQAAFSSDAVIDAEYRGELKDLKFVTYSDYNLSQYKILEEFKEMYEKRHIPAKDIQVIVPMRTRGNISCRFLNEEIQKIVNNRDFVNCTQVNYSDNGIKWTVTYREGDRVIVTKNDYKAKTPSDEEIAIFNGNMGYIKKIYPNSMIVDLATIGEVVLYEAQYKDLNLAYCVTCHKMQGSSAPYVIFGCDMSNYALLSKELCYTAITRARKFCSVVVQNKAFFSAIKISRVKLKQTWLKDKLQKLFLTSGEECDIMDVEE